MGKSKKPQKTKELSVAIAEASSTGDPETRQQSQTPRKRGRPRKIIEKSESVVKNEESKAEGAQAIHEQGSGSQSKKIKTSQEEAAAQQQVEAEGPSSSTRGKKKEDGKSEGKEPPRRSRRRKSKPRKSS
ncbi:NUCLEOPORIN NUP159-LIKE [Salix purpurea]|uniref:NUCLEOPORIN NUP159-LIKE n=1 Tax=Salix purpurea TaxID=77065 RepID=A0A9Q0PGA2_SALPP|nr:NUCLEOPORIN NUP159-LIKE [Salix purpurea]